MIKEITFEIKETTGLEVLDGLRKLEYLRKPFIIPASIYFTGFASGGPLIKGSRDSATAVKYFTALIFWFVLPRSDPYSGHQGKMNRKLTMIIYFELLTHKDFPNTHKRIYVLKGVLYD